MIQYSHSEIRKTQAHFRKNSRFPYFHAPNGTETYNTRSLWNVITKRTLAYYGKAAKVPTDKFIISLKSQHTAHRVIHELKVHPDTAVTEIYVKGMLYTVFGT